MQHFYITSVHRESTKITRESRVVVVVGKNEGQQEKVHKTDIHLPKNQVESSSRVFLHFLPSPSLLFSCLDSCQASFFLFLFFDLSNSNSKGITGLFSSLPFLPSDSSTSSFQVMLFSSSS